MQFNIVLVVFSDVYFRKLNSKLKSSPEYFGWSRDQIIWNPRGFSENMITFQPRSYPGELYNIAIYYIYLHLKKAHRSELWKLPSFHVSNNLTDKR